MNKLKVCMYGQEKEKELAYMGWRRREAFFCNSVMFNSFVSSVYELHCKLESLLTRPQMINLWHFRSQVFWMQNSARSCLVLLWNICSIVCVKQWFPTWGSGCPTGSQGYKRYFPLVFSFFFFFHFTALGLYHSDPDPDQIRSDH